MSELLSVRGVTKSFRESGHSARRVAAIEDVSFDVGSGETVGLVGRSGCGKSTTARCVLQLLRPDVGVVEFQGRNLTALRGRALREGRHGMQAVFQDPTASFDPRHTILQSVMEPLESLSVEPVERAARAREQLDFVGLRTLEERKPYELSGGQVQRAAIARALVSRPRLIVLDEPTSALDLSIQAQILNLLRDVQQATDVAMVLISHDFGVINIVCRRVVVMDEGRIVEEGPTRDVLDRPRSEIARRLREVALVSTPPSLAPPRHERGAATRADK
jgi:ABC-type glutathione transport system ATPase component